VSTPTKPRVGELIHRGWGLAESRDTTRFEALMRAAVAAGLVRTWDDGRGRCPWYEARRGAAERALLARCTEALGAAPEETTL
jgi:hypothetical protein